MGIPKLRKTREEVNADYQRRLDEKPECSGLIHQIDTSGSCQCGFFIDGTPSGTFPFVPNRTSRRMLSSFKRGKYVKTEEDIQRMKEQRDAEQARREVRELARLSRRERSENQPPIAVEILVGAAEGSSTDGESQVD